MEQFEALLEVVGEALESEKIHDVISKIAKLAFSFKTSLVNAGFTEEQAMEIIISLKGNLKYNAG